MLGEAAHDSHPLRWRRAGDLVAQQRHRLGERAEAVPTQFHVVAQATADEVCVAVDKPGNYAATFEIDAGRGGSSKLLNIAPLAHFGKATVADCHRVGLRFLTV